MIWIILALSITTVVGPFVVANNDSIAQRLNLFRRSTEAKAKDKLAR